MTYQIAADSFAYSDNANLLSVAPKWSSAGGGGIGVSSGRAYCVSPMDIVFYYNAALFPNDQYAEGTLSTVGTDDDIGLAVRCQTGSSDCYGVYIRALYFSIFKWVSGVFTTLGYGFPSLTAPVVARFQALGPLLTLSFGGVPVMSRSDSALTSGYAGMVGRGNGTPGYLDDWAAGGMAAVAPNSEYTRAIGRPGGLGRVFRR